MRFQFMKDHNKEFCVIRMAKVLKVSRAGYYKFLKATESKRKLRNKELVKQIQEAFKKSRRSYGSPRIYGRRGEK